MSDVEPSAPRALYTTKDSIVHGLRKQGRLQWNPCTTERGIVFRQLPEGQLAQHDSTLTALVKGYWIILQG